MYSGGGNVQNVVFYEEATVDCEFVSNLERTAVGVGRYDMIGKASDIQFLPRLVVLPYSTDGILIRYSELQ